MFRVAQTRSLDRHLLPVHHAVTGFFSPAVSTPRGMLLMPLPGQVPHFFLHHQAHQRQPGLAHQVAHAFLQQTHDLGHRKNHLKVGILFAGQLPEFLHRSLLVDLVSFLHSDSLLFLGRKNHPRPIMTADVRVATFYELTGILPLRSLTYSPVSPGWSRSSRTVVSWWDPLAPAFHSGGATNANAQNQTVIAALKRGCSQHPARNRVSGSLLAQRVLPAQPRKPRKITIRRIKHASILNRQRRDLRITHERARGAPF